MKVNRICDGRKIIRGRIVPLSHDLFHFTPRFEAVYGDERVDGEKFDRLWFLQ